VLGQPGVEEGLVPHGVQGGHHDIRGRHLRHHIVKKNVQCLETVNNTHLDFKSEGQKVS
jgi:hypothetical protein